MFAFIFLFRLKHCDILTIPQLCYVPCNDKKVFINLVNCISFLFLFFRLQNLFTEMCSNKIFVKFLPQCFWILYLFFLFWFGVDKLFAFVLNRTIWSCGLLILFDCSFRIKFDPSCLNKIFELFIFLFLD